MLMVPFRQPRLSHGGDLKDILGRATLAVYGSPDLAGAIPGLESIHGAVDAGSPFAASSFGV